MSLSGKQKRYLRALGTEMEPIVHIGKGGINENLLKQVVEGLEARELIKVRLLPNSEYEVAEIALDIAEKTEAELVQKIGRNFLLYKKSTKKNIITLP
ncbi:MAG: ribosome assembly RNA-binding protein YhbY [Bacillota bacterium]